MTSIWDVYLDASDAADLLHAVAVVERHRAVREPLPLDDAARLLERLGIVGGIARDEAVHWDHESEDRRLEAEVDGGRWGSVEVAHRMAEVAVELAAGSREIAASCAVACTDLAPRLQADPRREAAAVDAAIAETARRLLEGHPDDAHDDVRDDGPGGGPGGGPDHDP